MSFAISSILGILSQLKQGTLIRSIGLSPNGDGAFAKTMISGLDNIALPRSFSICPIEASWSVILDIFCSASSLSARSIPRCCLSISFSFRFNGELTDFLPWQWARDARLTGQKVRSNDWFAPQSGAGQSGGLTQSGNSPNH